MGTGVVELGIPWSVMGLDAPAPVARFTTVAFREDANTGNTQDLGGSGISDAWMWLVTAATRGYRIMRIPGHAM